MWKDKSLLIKQVLVTICTNVLNFSYPANVQSSPEVLTSDYLTQTRKFRIILKNPSPPQPALLHSKEF